MARMPGRTFRSGRWCVCCIGPLAVSRSAEKRQVAHEAWQELTLTEQEAYLAGLPDDDYESTEQDRIASIGADVLTVDAEAMQRGHGSAHAWLDFEVGQRVAVQCEDMHAEATVVGWTSEDRVLLSIDLQTRYRLEHPYLRGPVELTLEREW